MKKKILLPFEEQPYTVMYQFLAFSMGIIQANAKADITPWLCGKFINCRVDLRDGHTLSGFVINLDDHWGMRDQILLRERLVLFPEIFDVLFNDCLAFLRDMLDRKCYVYGNYNEEYIPGKWSYQKKYYKHDFLLIGYDEEEQVFHSVGYLGDENFQRFDISYDNMRRALESLKHPKITFSFWQYNPDAIFTLKLDRIIDELNDYLLSNAPLNECMDGRFWGVNGMRILANYFLKCAQERRYIDYRYTRGLMEHKFFMKMRVEYFLKNGYLNDEEYLQYAQKIYKISETIHMLGIKYSMTGKTSAMRRSNELVEEMIQMESEYLPGVMASLRSFSKGGHNEK